MTNDVLATDDYRSFIAELKSRVQAAQIKAAVTVNRELLLLYWDLGRMLTERQDASGWGDGVIRQIAKDLSREFPHLKGFSRSNLYNIKQWYGFYLGQDESVQQAVGQIPWGHNVLIVQRVKDPEGKRRQTGGNQRAAALTRSGNGAMTGLTA